MLTKDIPPQDLQWLYEQNLLVPMPWGARLLLDRVMQDWRDVPPRISVPTLVVGGEASHVAPASQAWTADRVPNAELRVFTREEGADVADDQPGHRHLLVRRNRNSGELAFYHCYSAAPVPLATLVRVAGRRWTVEETFQAAKGLAGLDEPQVRRWTSWHRWVTLAMLAMSSWLRPPHTNRTTTRPQAS
ncbi:hypothetical protein JHN63_43085 [Streptomyces sp. MBT65]|nr:hypothetical protein [Streptomyces sp. MBT65]